MSSLRSLSLVVALLPEGNRQASFLLYGRLQFAKVFRVLNKRLGCSFISGLLADRTCWPRWNPLAQSSFLQRAVSPERNSGLVSHGLTCLPSHSIPYATFRHAILVLNTSV